MHINISDELSHKLENRVKTSNEFKTVEEYVEYVLAEVLKQTEGPAEEVYDKKQEDSVKQRLEDLGYLD